MAPTETFVFRCGHCHQPLRALPSQQGSRFRCVHCSTLGKVPAAPSSKSPAEPTSMRPNQAPRIDSGSPLAGEFNFRRPRAEEDGLDMTPMVDVTFLLLIFFMITASFSLQKSLEMPASDQSESVAQQRTIEELEQDDDYLIVRIDQENVVWVNEHEAPTRHELLSQLQEARDTSQKAPGHLLVYAHGDALHDKVVMVLDVGNALGFEHVRLATEELE